MLSRRTPPTPATSMAVVDVGGQRMYRELVHLMLTDSLTVYVAVFSLEHELTELLQNEDASSGLTYGDDFDDWLLAIHAHAPSAPIVVVATQIDKVPDLAERDRRVDALWDSFNGAPYRRQIRQIVRVCSKSEPPQGLDDVHAAVEARVADSRGLKGYGELVPLSWFKFRSIVGELAAQTPARRRLTLVEAEHIAMQSCQFATREEVHDMLRRFNDLGLLLWRDSPHHSQSRELVVIDLQWMGEQIKELVCRRSIDRKARAFNSAEWDELQRSGRLEGSMLAQLWPGLTEQERGQVLEVMESFGLCFPVRLGESYIVPSLLPTGDLKSPQWVADSNVHTLRVCTAFSWAAGQRGYLPDALFYRLMTALSAAAHKDGAYDELACTRRAMEVKNLQHRFVLERCTSQSPGAGLHRSHYLRLSVYDEEEHGPKLSAVVASVRAHLEALCVQISASSIDLRSSASFMERRKAPR